MILCQSQQHASRRPPTPTEDLPAWRRACLAYREKPRAGAHDLEAPPSQPLRPSRRVWPLLWKEASAEVLNAIAYATRHFPEWFWQGARLTQGAGG
jgi:hypothetical protein